MTTEVEGVTGFDDALQRCGVAAETLGAAERDALDRQGFVVLNGVIGPDRLARMRAAFEAAEARGRRHGQHVRLGWDEAFDPVYAHPRVLAAAFHVLRRPFTVPAAAGRAPAPGEGLQGLHTDWVPRRPDEPFHVVIALWLLDDFTAENGATRVVPGSHRAARPLPKALQQPGSVHPDQRVVTAAAGSALVFNGHLWHGGTRNTAGVPRRVLQVQLRATDQVRPDDSPASPPDRLPPAVRYLLGRDG